MKPVDQTIFGFEKGNCMQACIASIFEVSLDEIPNFMRDGEKNYLYNLNEWCDEFGIICFDVGADGDSSKIFKDMHVIITGKSPRDESKQHAVIYYNGKMIHDPHVDKTGIIGEPLFIMVFAIKNYPEFQ